MGVVAQQSAQSPLRPQPHERINAPTNMIVEASKGSGAREEESRPVLCPSFQSHCPISISCLSHASIHVVVVPRDFRVRMPGKRSFVPLDYLVS